MEKILYVKPDCMETILADMKNWEIEEVEIHEGEKVGPPKGTVEIQKPVLPTVDFFKALREVFPIGRIYYPGSGNDDILERAFDPDEIFYLDQNYSLYPDFHKSKIGTRRLVANVYSKHSFQDGVFDAIHYEDNHANKKEFRSILKTLKTGGIIIVGATCEGTMDRESFRNWPRLNRLELPFEGDRFGVRYGVYQKVLRRPSTPDRI